MESTPAERALQENRKAQSNAARLPIFLLLLIAMLMLVKALYTYEHAKQRAQDCSMSISEIVHKETIDISNLTQEGIEDRQFIYREYISIQKDVFVILMAIMAAISFYGISLWKRRYQELCNRLARAKQ